MAYNYLPPDVVPGGKYNACLTSLEYQPLIGMISITMYFEGGAM